MSTSTEPAATTDGMNSARLFVHQLVRSRIGTTSLLVHHRYRPSTDETLRSVEGIAGYITQLTKQKKGTPRAGNPGDPFEGPSSAERRGRFIPS